MVFPTWNKRKKREKKREKKRKKREVSYNIMLVRPVYVFCHLCNKNYTKEEFQKHSCLTRIVLYDFPHQFDLASLVSHKHVILVGPSLTTEKCNLGSFIDSFDIVIRINNSVPIPSHMKPHIGSKTTMLYHYLHPENQLAIQRMHPKILSKYVDYIRCSYPFVPPFSHDISFYHRLNKTNMKLSTIDKKFYLTLEWNLRTRPYSGTCAITELLCYPILSLYVLGVDFYTYAYNSTYKRVNNMRLEQLRKNHIHDRKPQIKLIQRLYLIDSRIHIDNILKNVLLEPYDSFFHAVKKHIHIPLSFPKEVLITEKKQPGNILHIQSCKASHAHFLKEDIKKIDKQMVLKIKKFLLLYKITSGTLSFLNFVTLLAILHSSPVKTDIPMNSWKNRYELEQVLLHKYFLKRGLLLIL